MRVTGLFIWKTLEKLEGMHECKESSIVMKEDISKRKGLSSKISFQCNTCSKEVTMSTNKPVDNIQSNDVNIRSVFAASEVGLGREGFATLCEIFNMPPPVQDSAFQKYNKKLNIVTKEKVSEHLKESVEEVRTVLGEKGNHILDIAVSFDGTWSKRGFTANFGIGFVISTDTGKVLDYVVMSKVCEVCKAGERLKKDGEKYQEWQRNHLGSGECQKNFDGSSSSMEKEAAKILWGRSVELHKCRYNKMICDGDSKAYMEVWDIYGVCSLCSKYEFMNKKQPEYEKWLKSVSYKRYIDSHANGSATCNRVDKMDCIGHVQKRMGRNLIALSSKTKLEDGKPVGGRSGRLTRPAIDRLQKYYGNAIRSTADQNAKTKDQQDKALSRMQTSIKAVLYHSVKLDIQEERHKYCPIDSWCSYQNTKAVTGTASFQDKPHHLDPVFLNFLLPLFERLSTPSLLTRCLPGFSQNANESLNALVWNRCPKHRNKGFVNVETAAGSALLQFNMGASGRHCIIEGLGITHGKYFKSGSERKDRRRIQTADARAQKKFQVARQRIGEAKLQEEERLKRLEGITYQAGGFNEELLIRCGRKSIGLKS